MYIGNDAAQQMKMGAIMGQQTMASSGLVGAMVADSPRRPELAEYMERLAMAIARNEELASQLSVRLEGVLRSAAPCTDNCANKTSGPNTYYGSQVQGAIDRIASVNDRLHDVLNRLEA